MSWGDVVQGISRDLGELAGAGLGGWLAIAAFVALPFGAAAVITIAKRRAAWISLVLWLAVAGAWVFYYLVGANLGLGAAVPWVVVLAVGWLVFAGALVSWARASRGPAAAAGPR